MKNGVYNKVEQKMVDDTINIINPMVEANTTVNVPFASRDAIKNFTEWADPWNPLFADEEYAKETAYGCRIAPPHFLESVNSLVIWPPHPEEGFLDHDYAGDYFEYDRPIKVGDEFTVKRKINTLEDITEQVGDGLRHFAFGNNLCSVFDKEGKRVGYSETLVGLTLRDAPNVPNLEGSIYEDHYYTQEEWDYINGIIHGEQIRGKETRYWEDVQLGEKLTPVTLGPTTIWDMVAFCAARHEVPYNPSRCFREIPEGVNVGERTNNTYMPLCWHFDREMSALLGDVRPFNFGGSGANQMLRIVTNWCGDEGQVRVNNWRHVTRTYHGDCTIGSGQVIRKYKRGDEYCVDIFTNLMNVCRGHLSEVAVITVALPTRGDGADLDAMCGEIAMKSFENGDKVRVAKLPDYYLPSGYPLEHAEGTVQFKFQWQAASFHPFGGYVGVKVSKNDTPLTMGDVVILPTELLEKM